MCGDRCAPVVDEGGDGMGETGAELDELIRKAKKQV